jgi:glycine hydroxymethyltransferase
MKDYLFRGDLEEVDADVFRLTQLEAERQARKLILIPSESQAPMAVREALSSTFQNIYAEGYPDEEMRLLSDAEILNYDDRLTFYRRFSDPRYYKGVEYVDLVESLARFRVAKAFETNTVPWDKIFVNVQALSGAPANNAIYHALINPGDTILGMTLAHGGHLSHGSPVNRSGKIYHASQYSVDHETEQINYNQIEEIARQLKPKIIVAGYSSYPWAVDWDKFHQIAKAVGAYLMADIAHVAGLVVAGVYPSPVGIADVVSFTTHKSLCGPRGACILSFDPTISRKIDRAVFPGEQGGPHINTIAAIAVTMKLVKTKKFVELQNQIVKNCFVFTERLKQNGFRIPFGGTNTHLTNLDCSTIVGKDGTKLSGDQAARILDIAGIVVNRNTIPGDLTAIDPSGIRMGTPWVTQRGFKETEMLQLADLISDLINAMEPFSLESRKGEMRRSKVDFNVLEKVKIEVRELAQIAGIDFKPTHHSYPHYFYQDDPVEKDYVVYHLSGEKIQQFINYVFTSDAESLTFNQVQSSIVFTPFGEINCVLKRIGQSDFQLSVPIEFASKLAAWLRDLSDGYIVFDDDPLRKIPGPVSIRKDNVAGRIISRTKITPCEWKPFFIGIRDNITPPIKSFKWVENEQPIRRTPLYDTHKKLGAKIIPFAGWEMPVWYTSIVEEHIAVRQAAGIFDVSHMGVYQVEGDTAGIFLDSVVGNDINNLEIGESCYTHFLTPQAEVIDDLLVYHRAPKKFMLVVNAANDDKDWSWLNAVRNGEVRVSEERQGSKVFGRNVLLRNLRDPKENDEMRVDIALQGPKSREILLALGTDDHTKERILNLKRTQLCEAIVGGFNLIVSRTGYTGERMAFELFVHPNMSDELFNKLLQIGTTFGLKPIGLGARDSLRTEAGLPLYGHEMGLGSGKRGEKDLGVGEAGFLSYVKLYKPWFIGREAFINREKNRKVEVVRFRFVEKGIRMAHSSDPVLDRKGRVIGYVTSCAIDQEGYLTGQACLDVKNTEEDTLIFIYQGAPDKPNKAPNDLSINEKVNLPSQALVVSRFLK